MLQRIMITLAFLGTATAGAIIGFRYHSWLVSHSKGDAFWCVFYLVTVALQACLAHVQLTVARQNRDNEARRQRMILHIRTELHPEL